MVMEIIRGYTLGKDTLWNYRRWSTNTLARY